MPKVASHPLGLVTVHYSSPEAGYGPIVAGPEGLEYLTLRRVSEQGAFYLPDEREAALVLLYRLLFVLYAEDRDLLPVRDHRYDEGDASHAGSLNIRM